MLTYLQSNPSGMFLIIIGRITRVNRVKSWENSTNGVSFSGKNNLNLIYLLIALILRFRSQNWGIFKINKIKFEAEAKAA